MWINVLQASHRPVNVINHFNGWAFFRVFFYIRATIDNPALEIITIIMSNEKSGNKIFLLT